MDIRSFTGKKKLTRDDNALELFFIGTGGAFSQEYHNTNFLVIKGDTHVLVDFGITGPQALREVGLLPTDIKAFLPTHLHADHVGGVENLLLMHRYVAHTKPVLIADEDMKDDLWSYTLRGGCQYGFDASGRGVMLGMSDYFDDFWKGSRPIDGKMHYGGIEFQLFRTRHMPMVAGYPPFDSYGLIIDDRVYFSGDAKLNVDNVKHYAHCEMIIHDCSFHDVPTHASLYDLQGLPSEIRGKTYAVHYGDGRDKHQLGGLAGWIEQGVSYILGDD